MLYYNNFRDIVVDLNNIDFNITGAEIIAKNSFITLPWVIYKVETTLGTYIRLYELQK